MDKAYDILVAGGGIAGLWAAKCAREAGFSVCIADVGDFSAGASETPLGALMPHLPDAVSAKRRFQWAALNDLGATIAELCADAPFQAGDIYRRTGRVTPVRREGFIPRAQKAAARSGQLWDFGSRKYAVHLLDQQEAARWLPGAAAPFGAIFDELSAGVHSSAYRAALLHNVRKAADVRANSKIVAWEGARGRAQTQSGETIVAERLVVAAGAGSFPLLAQLTGRNYGHAVKGQAAVFFYTAPDDWPILYDDGTYIVPHRDVVCVGSTSETTFEEPTAITRAEIDPVVARATAMMPALAEVKLLNYWADVRPRSAAKDPVVGCLDPDQRIYAMTGAFKITLGIGHRLGTALADILLGRADTTGLPETYCADSHIAQAKPSA